jgi:hypothetical protein
VTEYDFEHLEYLISNVQEGEMEPEEAIAEDNSCELI